MGLLSRIGGWFKRVFRGGRKDEVPPIEPKSVEKIVGAETEIEEYTEEGKTEKGDVGGIVEPKTKEPEIKGYEERAPEDKIKKFQDKNKELQFKYTTITKGEKEEIRSILTSELEVINTGYYNSYMHLKNSRYDIYRNILMGAIRSDSPGSNELVQRIYQSGMLDDHITARLKVLIRTTLKDGNNVLREVEFEVLGLTPDRALDLDVHNRLMEFTKGNNNELRNHIENVCQTAITSSDGISGSENEVMKVQISFNYA